MYKALYRKWRPQTFSDVVGQRHITSTLKNQVKESKTSHAYLFTGTRGTGKTSCAKILAKAVNCLNPKNGDPCNECEICIGINNGSILDIIEIDAASNNGVDDIRELRDEVIYTPAVTRKKVYIIDEVHMLSSGAWNALLKTLEEPPSHIMFILATTEIQKVPQTITSRCQRYDFKRISPTDILSRLEFICKNEKFKYEEDALNQIAILADGSMRDGLSILEKCIITNSKITIDVVDSATGGIGNLYLYKFTNFIINNDTTSALTSIRTEYDNSKDMDLFLAQILTHFRNLLIAKAVSSPAPLIECTVAELKKIVEQANGISLERIMYSIDIVVDTLSKIQNNTLSRILIELCVLKLCDVKTDTSNTALLSRISKLENKFSSEKIVNIIPVSPTDKPLQEPINVIKTPSETTKTENIIENEILLIQNDVPKIEEDIEQNTKQKNLPADFIPALIENLKVANQNKVLCFLKDVKVKLQGNILYLYTSNIIAISIFNNVETNKIIANSVAGITGENYKVIAKDNIEDKKTIKKDNFMELHEDILKGE